MVWHLFRRRDSSTNAQSIDKDGDGEVFVTRGGQILKADEAFFAWQSGDIQRMVRALDIHTNPIDRHFLLQSLATATYKLRNNPEMADLCVKVAEIHLDEFSRIAPALKEDMGGTLPRVSTFQHFATLLTERGEFERAIKVCKEALLHDLHDGTKSGYKGRIERINRKAE